MSDLELDRPYRGGDSGTQVKLIQEWLSLHGLHVKIDGGFGPATESALRQFQTQQGLAATGIADPATFERLVAPMRGALAPIAARGRGLGPLVVAYAQQHLAQHPREIGGQNRGPWVRLYMDGKEGADWAWCAGFVCFCLQQACTGLGVPLPIERSPSCDSLAASARRRGSLLEAPAEPDRARIGPGSVFLNRRTATDWTHTGIVVAAQPEVLQTIEGNTNDEGSREGYEVCARTRGYKDVDFIVI